MPRAPMYEGKKENIECRWKEYYLFVLVKRIERSDSFLRNSAVGCSAVLRFLIKTIDLILGVRFEY